MSTVKNQLIIGSELSKLNNLKEFFGKSENIPLDTNKIESGSINLFPFGISFDGKECIVIHKKKLSEQFGHKIVLEAFNLNDTPFGKKNTFVNISSSTFNKSGNSFKKSIDGVIFGYFNFISSFKRKLAHRPRNNVNSS